MKHLTCVLREDLGLTGKRITNLKKYRKKRSGQCDPGRHGGRAESESSDYFLFKIIVCGGEKESTRTIPRVYNNVLCKIGGVQSLPKKKITLCHAGCISKWECAGYYTDKKCVWLKCWISSCSIGSRHCSDEWLRICFSFSFHKHTPHLIVSYLLKDPVIFWSI